MRDRQLLETGLAQLQINNTQAVEKLLCFSEQLRKVNQVMNLTAVVTPEEIVTRHFLDCAVLTARMRAGMRVVDIGTGAGFPGLPLAILCPDTSFVLLDAQRKRIAFLQQVVERLQLNNVQPLHIRAEEFAKTAREQFHGVLSRAVADLRILVELGLPLLDLGGMLYAWKAVNCADELQGAAAAISELGGDTPQIETYCVPIAQVPRTLICVQKCKPTPMQYPRRFKKIQTQPLSGSLR